MMNEPNRRQVEGVRRVLRPRWYGTRQGRRVTAALGSAALAMIWAGAVVCWFLAPSTTARWITLGLTGVLVICAGVLSVLTVASEGVVSLAEKNLDERRPAERRHVYALAHRGNTWILGSATTVVAVMSVGHSILRIPTAVVFMLMVTAWTTHKIIPHLIACRRLEDALPDDE